MMTLCRCAGYSGYLLDRYDVPKFRERLERFFDVDLNTQTPLTAYQDRKVYVFTSQTGDWAGADTIYIKRYILVRAKQIVQALFRMHRAQKSWRIAHILLRKGILTPQPVAFLRRRTWWFSGEFILLTEGIPNGLSLREYVRHWFSAPTEGRQFLLKRRFIRSVAEFLGKLHLAGVYHGDLTANNIFIERRGEHVRVYLIDLDSVRSTCWISDQRRLKNLDELGRNFLDLRVFSVSDRIRFLTYYRATYVKETRTLRELFDEVRQRTQFRLKKHQQQFL